jgi:hypothetical protein
MKAKLISQATDEGEEGIIEINGIIYIGMDCLGYGNKIIENGTEIDVKLVVGIEDENQNDDMIFSGNPDRIKNLIYRNGWAYKAFGEIISINPEIIDCGNVLIESNFYFNDSNYNYIGKFITFNIERLDIWNID